MKEELKKEAYAAFRNQFGELPADAGYAVVKEKDDCVYFARTSEDWNSFLKSKQFFTRTMCIVLIAVIAIILIVSVGMMVTSQNVLALGLLAYIATIMSASLVVLCRQPRKCMIGREILVYESCNESFYVITL